MARTATTAGTEKRSESHTLKQRALEFSRMGADLAAQAARVAEHRLSEGTQASQKLAQQAELARQDVAKNAQQARKLATVYREDLREPRRKARQATIQAAKSTGRSKRRAKRDLNKAKKEFRAVMREVKMAGKPEKKKHRRWPWIVGLGVMAGSAIMYVTRAEPEAPVAPTPPRSTDVPNPPPESAAQTSRSSPDQSATQHPQSDPAGG